MERFTRPLVFGAIVAIVFTVIGTVSAQTYHFKIGHANAPLADSALHVASTAFADSLDKESGGRITATVYPSAQLGSDAEMIDLTVSGAQEVLCTSLNLITNYAKRLDVMILPYMFQDSTSFRQAIDVLWPDFDDYLGTQANLHLVTLWDSGFRHVMSTKPVHTLNDLRKLKFRVPPSPVMIKMVESWGISPTPVEWSELFNAMQLGVVDAFEVDDSVLISAHMNEVVKYITDDDHMLQVSTCVMNNKTYQSLPDDLKAAVDRASADAQQITMDRSGEILDTARSVSEDEHGVQFLGRPDDYDDWVSAARGTWPSFYERIGDGDAALGEEIVNRVSEAAGN